LSLLLIGCAAGPGSDVTAACAAQGHPSGSDAWRVCVEGGGAAVATGPGSPYLNSDKESEPD
jgi:hypothetical protein